MTKTTPSLMAIVSVFALAPIGPLAVDMYLPSIPQMVEEFRVTEAQMQLSITLYIIALGVAPLIGGPISDKVGRKKSALVGLVLYVIGSMLAAFSTELLLFYSARVLQGAGSAFAFVSALAWIRDHFDGAEAGKWMSYMGGMSSAIPMIAPLFGGILAVMWGWSSVFLTMAILAVVVLLLVSVNLKTETTDSVTIDVENAEKLRCNLRDVLTSRQFITYSSATMFCFGALMTYISTAPIVAITDGGMDELTFSIVFGAIGMVQFVSSMLGPKIVSVIGQRKTVTLGLSLSMAGGLGLLFVPSSATVLFFVLAALGCGGFSVLAGTAISLTLEPFKYCAGLATAADGFFRMVGGAAIAAVISSFGLGGAMSLSIALLLTSIPLILVMSNIKHERKLIEL